MFSYFKQFQQQGKIVVPFPNTVFMEGKIVVPFPAVNAQTQGKITYNIP